MSPGPNATHKSCQAAPTTAEPWYKALVTAPAPGTGLLYISKSEYLHAPFKKKAGGQNLSYDKTFLILLMAKNMS